MTFFWLHLKAQENCNHYNIMKSHILTVLIPLVTKTEFLITQSVQHQADE